MRSPPDLPPRRARARADNAIISDRHRTNPARDPCAGDGPGARLISPWPSQAAGSPHCAASPETPSAGSIREPGGETRRTRPGTSELRAESTGGREAAPESAGWEWGERRGEGEAGELGAYRVLACWMSASSTLMESLYAFCILLLRRRRCRPSHPSAAAPVTATPRFPGNLSGLAGRLAALSWWCRIGRRKVRLGDWVSSAARWGGVAWSGGGL